MQVSSIGTTTRVHDSHYTILYTYVIVLYGLVKVLYSHYTILYTYVIVLYGLVKVLYSHYTMRQL